MKKGVTVEQLHSVRRAWYRAMRWRWLTLVMAWAGVLGAWLAYPAYVAFMSAAFAPGLIDPALRNPVDVFRVWPEQRWPFVAGAVLLGAGAALGPFLASRRQGRREGVRGLILAACTLWVVGVTGRSAYLSAVTPGGLLAGAGRTVWAALDGKASWPRALGEGVTAVWRAVIRPNFYGAMAAPWGAEFLARRFGVPRQAGLVLWGGGWLGIVLAPLVSRRMWRYLVFAPPVQVLVYTAWDRQPPPDLSVLRPHRPDPHAFDGLVGVDHAVELLRAQLEAWLRHHEAAWFNVRPARGILLYGPPGTGKTSLARAAAKYCGCNIIVASTADLLGNGLVGQAEQRLRDVFREARASKPCIVFFDEIDAIGARRDGRHANRPADLLLPVLLQEMDGYHPLEGVLVIGSTNRPDVLDEALLRRFTCRIEVGKPGPEAVEVLLRRWLSGVADDSFDWKGVANKLKGFSPADIENVCEVAKQIRWAEYLRTGRAEPLRWEHLARALLAEKGGTPEAAEPGWTFRQLGMPEKHEQRGQGDGIGGAA